MVALGWVSGIMVALAIHLTIGAVTAGIFQPYLEKKSKELEDYMGLFWLIFFGSIVLGIALFPLPALFFQDSVRDIAYKVLSISWLFWACFLLFFLMVGDHGVGPRKEMLNAMVKLNALCFLIGYLVIDCGSKGIIPIRDIIHNLHDRCFKFGEKLAG